MMKTTMIVPFIRGLYSIGEMKQVFLCPRPDNSLFKSKTNRYVCRPAQLPYYLTRSDTSLEMTATTMEPHKQRLLEIG